MPVPKAQDFANLLSMAEAPRSLDASLDRNGDDMTMGDGLIDEGREADALAALKKATEGRVEAIRANLADQTLDGELWRQFPGDAF